MARLRLLGFLATACLFVLSASNPGAADESPSAAVPLQQSGSPPSKLTPPPLPSKLTPPPLPPEPLYFVGVHGDPVGPWTLDELKDHIARDKLTGKTLVWEAGTKDWIPLSNLSSIANMPISLIGRWSLSVKEEGQGQNLEVGGFHFDANHECKIQMVSLKGPSHPDGVALCTWSVSNTDDDTARVTIVPRPEFRELGTIYIDVPR